MERNEKQQPASLLQYAMLVTSKAHGGHEPPDSQHPSNEGVDTAHVLQGYMLSSAGTRPLRNSVKICSGRAGGQRAEAVEACAQFSKKPCSRQAFVGSTWIPNVHLRLHSIGSRVHAARHKSHASAHGAFVSTASLHREESIGHVHSLHKETRAIH